MKSLNYPRLVVDPAFRLMRFPLDDELDFIWKIDFLLII